MAKLKDIDIQQFLDELESIRSPDGFHSFRFDELTTIINSFVEFDESIPQSSRYPIVFASLMGSGAKNKVTKEKFLKYLNQNEKKYLNTPNKKFYYLSSLSFVLPKDLNRIRLNGLTINFGISYPTKFTRDSLNISHSLLEKEKQTIAYTKCWIHTPARTQFEACEKAQQSIDLLRAIWNLKLNNSMRASSGFPKPVNTIITGPVHTIHTSNGKPAGSTYWYEPNFPESFPPKPLNSDYLKTRKFEKFFLRYLRKSSYQEILIDALLRYCRALDSTDFQTAFVKLWSVLETLTDTDNAYKETIKRCSFLFQNREYHRNVLDHLRRQRNSYVHRGFEMAEPEGILYQLQSYVDHLVRFHVLRKNPFPDMKAAKEFMDMPSDPDVLLKQISKAKKALRFCGYYDKKTRA
ncbi:MAG: hypothetical protein AB3N63_17990 [Puniceicoccaceae bacterium]